MNTMKLQNLQSAFPGKPSLTVTDIVCFAAILLSSQSLFAQQGAAQPVAPAQSAAPAQSQVMTTTTTAPAEQPAAKIPNDQLDSLVAPIALYPDPLVAQVLAASTYPLEIVQLEQWMANNKTVKDKALADAVAKLPFDPSVQSLAAFPDVVKQLSQHVSWTMDLGNAFLAQQSDVMDAVQRMRAKAKGTGNLQTTAQQKVETQSVEGGKEVIVIEPADPQVVYVPQYSPTVVYGAAPAYPYPYAYPPGYGAMAFGVGIAMGAAWGSCWGNCNWHGGGDVTINNNNNFNKNNINAGNRNQAGQGGKWNHNPSHRGGAPYGDRGSANKYGGRARQQPAAGAGNRPGSGAGNLGGAGNRPGGGAGAGNIGGANRPGGGAGAGNIGGANRPGGGAGAGGASRPGGGASASTRPAGGGGSNSIGNRSVSSGGFGGSNAFGGGGGSSARSASSRGGHSMGGGGFSGGGGRGGGGGGRGGGGGGRGGGGGGRRR